jgi:predicted NBD/HSP70 family sugar kinase/transcriptional regulator with XRE-family HTH domain
VSDQLHIPEAPPRHDDAPSDLLSHLDSIIDRDEIARGSYEDTDGRHVLLVGLAEARERSGRSQVEIATAMGTTQSVVSALEREHVDPRLSSLQRYARACGTALVVRLDGDVVTDDVSLAAAGDDSFGPLSGPLDDPVAQGAYLDAAIREALVARLVQVRKLRGLSQTEVARVMGVTQPAVSAIENERVDPRLSSLQLFARACGVRLEVHEQSTAFRDAEEATAHPDALSHEGVTIATSQGIEESLRRLITETGSSGLAEHQLLEAAPVSAPAIGKTLALLSEAGYISAVPSGDRAPRRMKVNDDAAAFVGISVRSDHVRGLVTGLLPTRSAVECRELDLADASPSGVVTRIDDLVRLLVREFGVTPLGLGVELSGPVNGVTGTVIFAPDMQTRTTSSWSNVPLQAEIQQRTGIRTVVANDAKALATRELLLRRPSEGLIVVNLSESTQGIGAGLVFNDDLIRGVAGASAELGHIRVKSRHEGAVRCERCDGDRYGCLETEASGAAIARKLEADSLAAAARDARHDFAALATFEDAGRTLGRALRAHATLLNPEQLVIFGQAELLDERAHPSARAFTEGIAVEMAERPFSKPLDPRMVVTQRWEGPLAAASVAINAFLSQQEALRWGIGASPVHGSR